MCQCVITVFFRRLFCFAIDYMVFTVYYFVVFTAQRYDFFNSESGTRYVKGQMSKVKGQKTSDSCCGFTTFSSLPLAIIRNSGYWDLKSRYSIASYEERFGEPFDSHRQRIHKSAAINCDLFGVICTHIICFLVSYFLSIFNVYNLFKIRHFVYQHNISSVVNNSSYYR